MRLEFRLDELYDSSESASDVGNLLFATKDLTFEIPATDVASGLSN